MRELGVEVSKKIHAKNKGALGERQVRDILNNYKLPSGEPVKAKRGCQHSGGTDSPDVEHNISNLHLEIKRTESMNPAKARLALLQAKKDAGVSLAAPISGHKVPKEFSNIENALISMHKLE